MAGQADKTESELSPAQRHIIKRPRLTRLLDEAEARVILLVAPAGYGKTTLAREWAATRGKRALWFRVRPSHSEVAALAMDLAHAITPVAPGAERSINEFIAAAPAPDRDPVHLADLLAEDIRDWPQHTWLVMDDYQSLSPGRSSQAVVARFIEKSGARVIVTSRERPTWVTPRQILYGQVLELRQSALAMNVGEAQEVLRSDERAAESIIALGKGWPAVIGLAAMLPGVDAARPVVAHDLYDDLAQELYAYLGEAAKDHLPWLCVPSTVSREFVQRLLGTELAERVVRDGMSVGFVSSADHDELEIHPLARRFLATKLSARDGRDARARQVLACLMECQQWDDAFNVVLEFELAASLPEVISRCFDFMTTTGRIGSVNSLIDEYESRGHTVDFPEVSLVRAEVALRRGESQLAELLAASAAANTESATLAARAFLCAGAAANLGDAGARARAHFAQALTHDSSVGVQRAALWGQFIASTVDQSDLWRSALRTLETARDPSATHAVRVQQARLISAAHAGGVGEAAAQGISTLSLLDHVADPLVRSGFLNSLADALIMAGRYREAEDVARREISEAERFQLDFVIPNALANVVGAKLGRGKYTAALQALDRVETVDPGGDAFVRTNRVGLRARTYLSMQDYAAAAALEQELDLTARADIVAEVLAVIAFAHALAGSTALATASVERANACRWFTATRIFTAAADLVCVAANGVGAGEKIQDLLSEIVDTGHIDSVVSILRAWPAGSAIFAADARGADLLRHAARVTGDLTLAKASGFATQARTAEISPREREVLELVAQGLRNREVAARLVLSEKTVKTHLQHIYEKLNVSSRTEAVTRARSRGLFD